ncbi:MAG: hypothetical protein AAF907_05590 [Planctomycetota bacterium]
MQEISLASLSEDETLDLIFERVCRVDPTPPGACFFRLESVPADFDSAAFQQRQVNLVVSLSERVERRRGEPLAVVSAGRFDQQNTTRPHLDGGPAENLLILGYEPTEVPSSFFTYDLARFAADRELSPAEAMDRHNPMFPASDADWASYECKIEGFEGRSWRIVILNNSSTSRDGISWQGVLHAATVPRPDPSATRAVNSMMAAPPIAGRRNPLRRQALRLRRRRSGSPCRRITRVGRPYARVWRNGLSRGQLDYFHIPSVSPIPSRGEPVRTSSATT